MPVHVEKVEMNEVILCKMRGFCIWPGRISAIDNNQITVEFFGDNSTHKTTIKNIFDFFKSIDFMRDNLNGRKNPLYAKSIREAEIAMGIPLNQSILTNV